MASDKGWIKLNRQILENAIWTEEEPFSRRDAWIDLLLMANSKTKSFVYKGNNITVKRGQVYTSIRKLANRWHWGKDRTLHYIRLLEELNMIKRDSATHSATLLTIVNYGFYQDRADTHKDSDKDTHKDSDKDSDKPLLKNNKEYKEYKEEDAPLYSDDPERNAEIIDALNRGAVLNEDGSLDYSNVKSSWE